MIVAAKLGNPHGLLTLEVSGAQWIVEVGQPWRNERAGLKDEMLVKGVKLTVAGHRHADPKKRVFKAERVSSTARSSICTLIATDRPIAGFAPRAGIRSLIARVAVSPAT